MDPDPQDKPYKCKWSTFFALSFFITFIGIGISIFGAFMKYPSEDDFPKWASVGEKIMYVGIAILILGIICMIIGITCYCSIKRVSSMTFSDTTYAVAPNTISAVLQPPSVVESGSIPMYVYSYDPVERVEFSQIQTASNQNRPVHAVTTLAVPHEIKPEEPPPRYQEVMREWRYSTNGSAESEYGPGLQMMNIHGACRERLVQVNDKLQIPGATYWETAV